MNCPKPKRVVNKQAIEEARKPSCQVCGRYGAVEVHHIKSRGSGGGDTPDNLISLCYKCHTKAHTGKLSKDFLRERVNNG
jgi:5-methylcytosine-specific restriction endonuclease McrA